MALKFDDIKLAKRTITPWIYALMMRLVPAGGIPQSLRVHPLVGRAILSWG